MRTHIKPFTVSELHFYKVQHRNFNVRKAILSLKDSIIKCGESKLYVPEIGKYKRIITRSGTPITLLRRPEIHDWYVRVGPELVCINIALLVHGKFK